MSLQDLNWLAIIIGGVLYFVLGALWYSPLLFAKPFMKYRVKPGEQLDGGQPTEYLITLVNALITAVAVAIVVRLAEASTPVDGAAVGLLLAIGIAATTSLTYTIFSGPHKGLWLIYSGYKVVGFMIMGALFAVWK